jgi:hypothetical protein
LEIIIAQKIENTRSQMSNVYVDRGVKLVQDPKIVSYKNFDIDSFLIGLPEAKMNKTVQGDGKTTVEFGESKFTYKYVMASGITDVGPVKVEMCRLESADGLREGKDKAGMPTGRYTIPFKLVSNDPEHRKVLDVLHQIYMKVLNTFAEAIKQLSTPYAAMCIYGVKTFTNCLGKKAPDFTDDFRVTAWNGCKYICPIKLQPGTIAAPAEYITTWWIPVQHVVTDFFHTKFFVCEENPDTGKPEVNEVGPQLYMNYGIIGTPVVHFRDWFFSEANKSIRHTATSIMVYDFTEKSGGVETLTDVFNRSTSELDVIKSALAKARNNQAADASGPSMFGAAGAASPGGPGVSTQPVMTPEQVIQMQEQQQAAAQAATQAQEQAYYTQQQAQMQAQQQAAQQASAQQAQMQAQQQAAQQAQMQAQNDYMQAQAQAQFAATQAASSAQFPGQMPAPLTQMPAPLTQMPAPLTNNLATLVSPDGLFSAISGSA